MLLRCLVDTNFVDAQRAVGKVTTGFLSYDDDGDGNGGGLMLPLGPLGKPLPGSPVPGIHSADNAYRLLSSWNALLGLPDAMVKGCLFPDGSLMSVMGDLHRAHPPRGGTDAGMLTRSINNQTIKVGGSESLLPHITLADAGYPGPDGNPGYLLVSAPDTIKTPITVVHQVFSHADAERLALCWNALASLSERGIGSLGQALDMLCMLALARHAGRNPGVRIGDNDWDSCVLGYLIISARLEGGGYVLPTGMEIAAARLGRCCGEAAARIQMSRATIPEWASATDHADAG